MPGLSREQVRAFYDRFGSRQDWQAVYEDRALDDLIAHADFEHATAVFELGCGTGRLARRLLAERLPGSARYVGVDLSATMVALARRRVAAWADRAEVRLVDGQPVVQEGAWPRTSSASCSRSRTPRASRNTDGGCRKPSRDTAASSSRARARSSGSTGSGSRGGSRPSGTPPCHSG